MPICKRCSSQQVIKNGIVSGKQRYKCKDCNINFREGDNRTSETIQAKKAFCVLFYAMAKGSYRMLGRLLGVHHTQVYRWIRAFGEGLPEPEVPATITELEFDEMWHFIESKKTNFGSSKPLTVVQGEPWHGCLALVILQHSAACTRK